jgi:hypothetical protein
MPGAGRSVVAGTATDRARPRAPARGGWHVVVDVAMPAAQPDGTGTSHRAWRCPPRRRARSRRPALAEIYPLTRRGFALGMGPVASRTPLVRAAAGGGSTPVSPGTPKPKPARMVRGGRETAPHSTSWAGGRRGRGRLGCCVGGGKRPLTQHPGRAGVAAVGGSDVAWGAGNGPSLNILGQGAGRAGQQGGRECRSGGRRRRGQPDRSASAASARSSRDAEDRANPRSGGMTR